MPKAHEWADQFREDLLKAVERALKSGGGVVQLCGLLAQEYVAIVFTQRDADDRVELLRLAIAELAHGMLFRHEPPEKAAPAMDRYIQTQVMAAAEMLKEEEKTDE